MGLALFPRPPQPPLWPQHRPQTQFFFLFSVPHVIMAKTEYPGVAYRLGTWFGSRRLGFGVQCSESPGCLGTCGITMFSPSPVVGQKSALTTCLTTVKISYPGLAQLVARVVWDHQAGSSSLPSRTILDKT